MEIEDFEEDDENNLSPEKLPPQLKKKKPNIASTSTKLKKQFRDDCSSIGEIDNAKKYTKNDHISLKDDKIYIETSPKKRFGRVNKK